MELQNPHNYFTVWMITLPGHCWIPGSGSAVGIRSPEPPALLTQIELGPYRPMVFVRVRPCSGEPCLLRKFTPSYCPRCLI